MIVLWHEDGRIKNQNQMPTQASTRTMEKTPISLNSLDLRKNAVGGPHESRHAVPVLHVDVLPSGHQVGHDGRVAELGCQMQARTAFSISGRKD